MVQEKGSRRLLLQRFSRDFAGSVKYSTLWPSRRESPSAASRAMPTSGDFGGNANRGRVDIFVFCSPIIELQTAPVKDENRNKEQRLVGHVRGAGWRITGAVRHPRFGFLARRSDSRSYASRRASCSRSLSRMFTCNWSLTRPVFLSPRVSHKQKTKWRSAVEW